MLDGWKLGPPEPCVTALGGGGGVNLVDAAAAAKESNARAGSAADSRSSKSHQQHNEKRKDSAIPANVGPGLYHARGHGLEPPIGDHPLRAHPAHRSTGETTSSRADEHRLHLPAEQSSSSARPGPRPTVPKRDTTNSMIAEHGSYESYYTTQSTGGKET